MAVRDWLDKTTLVVAVAALGASCAAAIFAWKSVATARDTEERQLRAYLVVTDFVAICGECGDALVAGHPPNYVGGRMLNSGETPADQVSGRMGWVGWVADNGKDQLPADFDFSYNQPTGLVSAADIGRDQGKEFHGEITAGDVPLFRMAASGHSTLYVYGRIDYCDIFRKPRSTAFCFIYKPGVGESLPVCDRYNGEIPARHKCAH